jgi:hypothetical protein
MPNTVMHSSSGLLTHGGGGGWSLESSSSVSGAVRGRADWKPTESAKVTRLGKGGKVTLEDCSRATTAACSRGAEFNGLTGAPVGERSRLGRGRAGDTVSVW